MMSDRTERRFGTIKEVGVVPQNYAESAEAAAPARREARRAAPQAAGAEHADLLQRDGSTCPIPTRSARRQDRRRFPSSLAQPRARSPFPTAALGEQRRTVAWS